MKTLIFTQTASLTYILDETELSKEDFCLLLEMNGYEVPRNLPHGEFWQKSLESLSRLDSEEFYTIFNRFINFSPEEREIYRQLVAVRNLTNVPFESN